MAIEENVAVECCQRCDSKLDKGLCTDETCPFSETDQDDSRGWAGHPEKDCSEASDMIYNDIHQVWVDIATKQGWDEKSQIVHLSGYIMSISTPVDHFREYLQTCADAENAGYCETCQVLGHDTCSMTDGCPCCEDTKNGI